MGSSSWNVQAVVGANAQVGETREATKTGISWASGRHEWSRVAGLIPGKLTLDGISLAMATPAPGPIGVTKTL
jgi:hypothetical protein